MAAAYRSPSLSDSVPALLPESWVLLCQFRERSRCAISVLAYRLLGSPHDAICELLKTSRYEISQVVKEFINRGDAQPYMALSASTADLERAKEEAQGLGLFVRSLVGLDRRRRSRSSRAS